MQANLENLKDVLFVGNPIYDDMPKEQARIEGKREAFATLEAYFSQLEKSSGKGKVEGVEGEETGHEEQGDALSQSELCYLHC